MTQAALFGPVHRPMMISLAKLQFIQRQANDAFLLTRKRRMLATIRLQFGLRVGIPLESLAYTEVLFKRSNSGNPELYVIVEDTQVYEASIYAKHPGYSAKFPVNIRGNK